MRLPYNVQPLLINLPDYVLGEITIKRKAEVVKEIWDLHEKQVSVAFDVIPYKRNDDGSYGDRLDDVDSIFTSPRIVIVAANTYLIDTTTRRVICLTKDEFITFEETTILNPLLEGKNYLPDYDFYDMVARSQPIILAQMIGAAILTNF